MKVCFPFPAMNQVAKVGEYVRRLKKMIIPVKLQQALGLNSATAQSTTGRVKWIGPYNGGIRMNGDYILQTRETKCRLHRVGQGWLREFDDSMPDEYGLTYHKGTTRKSQLIILTSSQARLALLAGRKRVLRETGLMEA